MLPSINDQQKPLSRHVTLIGMAGVGKSTIGRIVARQLHTQLRDSDSDIESTLAMPINEIFAQFGETYFREKEHEIIAQYFHAPPMIIATGGGAWIQTGLREICQKNALNIWLKADIDTLWHNTKNRSHRPLLNGENPRQLLEDLIDKRDPVYAKADITIIQDGESKTRIATQIINAINEQLP